MKKAALSLLIFISIFSIFCIGSCNAENNTEEIISNETKSKLVEIKDSELKSLEDYQVTYGSDTYGLVAYILNKVRIYSIPFGILGIAISAIYQYVIGIRNLETHYKGFNTMIAVITLLVICQVLPLVFAIIVKGWR